ncbi:MAG: asparagine synthase (glutamine-hydrolyzing) [Flavobacteriales bacterium]|nr:asparagine synthase (glutamine-hydrolyzing) [Flavobacteriales bacterium]
MCNIGGEIAFNRDIDILSDLEIISKTNFHRGPDYQSSLLISENIGFTHNRLSIIDLTNLANQPFYSKNKDVAIVFNGEIYNFLELKNNLKNEGYHFITNSDTEVLISAYEVWGIEKTLSLIRGMYAFSLVDKSKKEMYLARDYFGKKPLYYYQDSKRFIFSSEINPLSKILKNKLTIDYNSLDYYLTELSMPQPNTIWKEIKQIPRNSYLAFDIQTNTYSISQSIKEFSYNNKVEISEKEAVEEVEKLIINSVTKRAISDVSLGCFLSGGIDSGLVTSILASNSGKKIKTFTLGFDYDDFNEFELAKSVALRYNTEHHEIKIDSNLIETIISISKFMGEPFADSSIIPSYLITKEIKKNITVALSGDGGDEIFGGYHEYETAFWADHFSQKGSLNFLNVSSSKILHKLNKSHVNLGYYYEFANSTPDTKLFRTMGFSNEEKLNLYSHPELKNATRFTTNYLTQIWKKTFTSSNLNALFNSSFDTRLINDYLVKIDRASMLNSLEVRSPFLDYDLAKLTSSIPNSILMKDGNRKYILKKLAQKYFDSEIFNRKKQGFGIPIVYWLNNELKPLVDEFLNSKRINARGLFDAKQVEFLINSHKKNHNQTDKIWALLILEMWFENNLN